MKKCGILLPVTSLPSKYGIGSFSDAAYDFVDWLKASGQSYWQILPLCPTGFGDSPYQSFSTFAGNPYLISLEEFIKEGLLTKNECEEADFGTDENYIDYEKMYLNRFPLLKKAYEKFKRDEKFEEFVRKNHMWLDDYAVFMALKYEFNQRVWNEWEDDFRLKKKAVIEKFKNDKKNEIEFWYFLQYKFFCQWSKLKSYANEKGVSIIGDIPIYVSYDSADVWSNPELFELSEDGLPINVAGCPPDGFSKTGQLWGNPLYDWKMHKETDYEWWIKRVESAFEMYDVLRIDHFRGFDEYYSIKYGSKDAVEGEWRKGPGAELFKKIEEKLGKKNIIAEDLGFITDSVREMLKECGYPGMKVLEFAFDSRDTGSANDYLPHNYPENAVAYTGTHDNQTLFSWLNTISEEEREMVRSYIEDYYTPNQKLNMSLIALIMRSNAKLCIVPVQDFLGLDDKARINVPSTTGQNWKWRLKKDQLDDSLKQKIFDMTKIFGRL